LFLQTTDVYVDAHVLYRFCL